MIAADAKLLTYVQAAERLNRTGTDKAKAKFIQRRVSNGELVVTSFSHRAKRISELDLQQFISDCRALEKTSGTKRRAARNRRSSS